MINKVINDLIDCAKKPKSIIFDDNDVLFNLVNK